MRFNEPCPVCADRTHDYRHHGELVMDCDTGEVMTTEELLLRTKAAS